MRAHPLWPAVTLLGLVVSVAWLATRLLAEPHAPMGRGSTAEHGSNPPAGSIATVSDALPPGGMEAESVPEPAQRVSAMSPLSQDSLSRSDKQMLSRVNFYLGEAGLEPIDPRARIHPDDLEVFREVVAANVKACDRAEHKWLRHGSKVLAAKRAAAFEGLERGDADSLPKMGPDNRLQRSHPHEAICQTVHLGVSYVFRVHPDEDPDLAMLGAGCESAYRSQAQDFDSRIRQLFRAR